VCAGHSARETHDALSDGVICILSDLSEIGLLLLSYSGRQCDWAFIFTLWVLVCIFPQAIWHAEVYLVTVQLIIMDLH